MDPVQPITPQPSLPVIERATAVRRVRRERDGRPSPEQDTRRRNDDSTGDEADDQAPGGRDDGRPHVDISV